MTLLWKQQAYYRPIIPDKDWEATAIDGAGRLYKSVGEIVKGNCHILSRGHKIFEGGDTTLNTKTPNLR
jgi:hypothetical protein